MKTPLRYAGGKSKAYKQITNLLPKNISTIVSPFIGGGSLESRWSSELNIKVIGYDAFQALTTFYGALLERPDELANKLAELKPDKETYNQIKEELLSWSYTQDLLKDWKTDYYRRNPTELDNLTAAAYFYFNHNLSYGPMYLGWISKIYQDQKKWDKMVDNIRNYSNPNLSVSHLSFEKSIPSHRTEFLYLDPPYYESGDLFKPIYPNSNIPVLHQGFNHNHLAELLKNHKGKFLLSYNDCEEVRELYKGFQFITPSWSYSMGNGETRSRTNVVKQSHELLIHNL